MWCCLGSKADGCIGQIPIMASVSRPTVRQWKPSSLKKEDTLYQMLWEIIVLHSNYLTGLYGVVLWLVLAITC